MSNILTEIAEAHSVYQEKLKELSQEKIQLACKDFFEKNPKVLAFAWTQYVPGFNDGDPCTFRVGELAVLYSRDALEVEPNAVHWKTKEPATIDLWDEDPTEEQIMEFSNHELGNEDSEYNIPQYGRVKPEFQAQADAMWDLWCMFNEDMLESIFGSDAHVVITPNNIVVNEYDCGY